MANDSRTESKTNENIKSLKRIFDRKNKESKISKNNFKRERSPIEKDRVISKMKSDAQAMGGDFKSAGELKPLKGESIESFKSRPSTKFFNKGGRVNFKGGGCAKRGVKKNAYGKNS